MRKDYNVTIRGFRPLMHSKYDLAIGNTKKQRGTVFNKEEEAEKCLYRDAKGKVYQPADHIEGACIKVGSKFTIPGAGKKTYKDRLKAYLFVNPQQIPFENGGSKDFEIDLRSGVIPSTRGRVPIARPRWDNWEFNFVIQVLDDELLPGDVVKQVLETAGREQGIGTFRPKFGLFEVVKFEEVKNN